MFIEAKKFNQDLSKWDVGSATDMDSMFFRAFAFNSYLSSWNVSSVGNAAKMFAGTLVFNQSLCDWYPRFPSHAILTGMFGANDTLAEHAKSCPKIADPTPLFCGPMCHSCLPCISS